MSVRKPRFAPRHAIALANLSIFLHLSVSTGTIPSTLGHDDARPDRLVVRLIDFERHVWLRLRVDCQYAALDWVTGTRISRDKLGRLARKVAAALRLQPGVALVAAPLRRVGGSGGVQPRHRIA